MKHIRTIAITALLAVSSLAFAQTGQSPQGDVSTSAQPMMSPEIIQSMKQMLQSCAMMMQATRSETGNAPMMQGDMEQMPMHGEMHGDMPMHGEMSEASSAMMGAMARWTLQ